MTKIKLLHVYRTYFPDPPGGLQEAIRQIALSTLKQGVENRIFTLSPHPLPGEIHQPEGLVVRTRSHIAPYSCDLGSLSAFKKFSQMARWADIIHYHFPWPFADMLHFGVRPKRPTIMTYHSDIMNKGIIEKAYKPLMVRMLGQMDVVVATSDAYINSSKILNNFVSRERLHTIPLCIDQLSYSEFIEASSQINLKDRFGVEDAQYFLFVGVLRSYKGLINLVKAANKTTLPIIIAGSGPEHNKLLIASKNTDNLRLVGQVSNVEKMALIKGCRAAVLPSTFRSEAFGVFLIEAAMCGKPLISCEIGTGTSFINRDKVTGLVVPPNNISALVEAMTVLANSNDLVARYGRCARMHYDNLFSGDTQGRAYTKLYRELYTRHRR